MTGVQTCALPIFVQKSLHLQVLLRNPLSRIKEYNDSPEVATCSQIPLDQWPPRSPNRFRHLCVTVPWEINQIEVLVDQEKIKKLRSAWYGADAGKPTATQQAVDQRGLADIGAAHNRDLRSLLTRELGERRDARDELGDRKSTRLNSSH